MKLLSKITVVLSAVAIGMLIVTVPVKAANGMPSNEEIYLRKQMENQKAENAKAKEYYEIQNRKAKAEKRPVSDIEMVKRQALEGIVQGNNNLLQMGDAALTLGQAGGEYNIAFMDQQAYEGFVSGMAELERIKQETWMQYTFRTH